MLPLLVFSVIRVRKWKCVKETLAIVSFVYLLNFIKGYLKMNTNVHHVQENFFISLQDCINKEEKSKKTCIEYWRREAERAKEESARRRALSIKIITEKSMILETLFLNIQKTNALKEQYERNLIAIWGGVIDDDKTKDYDIFLLVWNIYLLMYHVQRTMNIAGKCFITDPNYQGVSSMTIVITARRKKIHLYEE